MAKHNPILSPPFPVNASSPLHLPIALVLREVSVVEPGAKEGVNVGKKQRNMSPLGLGWEMTLMEVISKESYWLVSQAHKQNIEKRSKCPG